MFQIRKGHYTLKMYGDLAILGDRTQGYSHGYHPTNEKERV